MFAAVRFRSAGLATAIAAAVMLMGHATPGLAQTQVEQWYRWEVSLVTANDYYTGANPYRDLLVRVTYNPTSCTGSPWCQSFTGYGFWEGGKTFKLRSTFPQGQWSWTVTCSGVSRGINCANDTALNRSGTIDVRNDTIQDDPNAIDRYDLLERGLVRLSTNSGLKYLTYGDGQSVFHWRADTAWAPAIVDLDSNTRWITFLDNRAAKGFTAVLLSIAPTSDDPTTGSTVLFDDAAAGTPCNGATWPKSCSRWRTAKFFIKLDEKIRLANERGFVVVLVDVMDPLGNSTNNTALYPNSADAVIFARNLAARLSGSHVIFSPSFDDKLSSTSALLDAVGNALRDAAPRQLVTAHLAGGSSLCDYYDVHRRPWHQLHIFQSGHARSMSQCFTGEDTYECMARRARTFPDLLSPTPTNPPVCTWPAPTSTTAKPNANGEAAYDETWTAATTQIVDSPYGVRHSGYLSALNGAFGVTLGVGGPPPETIGGGIFDWVNITSQTLESDGSKQMKYLGDQFALNPWQMLQRRSGRIKNQPLATDEDQTMVLAATLDGNFAMIYMPNNTEIRFDGTFLNGFDCTSTTTWSVSWIDPKTGQQPQVPGKCFNISDASGATRQLVRPACAGNGTTGSCDWLVRLRRIGTGPALALASQDGAMGLEVASELASDGSGWRIVGQVQDSFGQPLGDSFPISETTKGANVRVKLPVVAREASGVFFVAWESEDDGDLHGIFARRVDGQGRLLDKEYAVNVTTARDQTNPWAAAHPGGLGGVVTWTSYDGDRGGVFARLVNPAGVPYGKEIAVNEATDGRQDFPKVAMNQQGQLVVAWTSEGQNEDSAAEDVYVRRFDDKGRPLGGEVRVNTTTAGGQWLTALESALDGGFLVTWTSYSTEGAERGIFSQTYDANGNPVGGEMLAVSAPAEGAQ